MLELAVDRRGGDVVVDTVFDWACGTAANAPALRFTDLRWSWARSAPEACCMNAAPVPPPTADAIALVAERTGAASPGMLTGSGSGARAAMAASDSGGAVRACCLRFGALCDAAAKATAAAVDPSPTVVAVAVGLLVILQ